MSCAHLAVDEQVVDEHGTVRLVRRCLVCGVAYDRGAVLERLRADLIRRKELPPIPPSPWSAAERSSDPW